jgi:O-antigen/teichoic acid export membrane protein
METGSIGRGLEEPLAGVMRRGASATLVVRAASAGLAFLVALALARLLGTQGYGAYAWAVGTVQVLSLVALLGLDQLLLKHAAVQRMRGGWGVLAGLLRRAVTAVTLASLAIALLAVALAELLEGGSDLGRHLELAVVGLPAAALAALYAGALQGLQRVATALAASTLFRQLGLLVALGCAYLVVGDELSSYAGVALQVGATFAALGLTWGLLRRAVGAIGGGEPEPAPDGWLRSGLTMGISYLLVSASWQLPLVAVGAFAGETQAGLYAVAAQATVVLVMVYEAGRTPLTPIVARLWASEERPRLQRGLTRATRWIGGLSVLAGAMLVVLAEPLLSIFGHEFEAGAPTLRILTVALALNAVTAFNGIALTMTGHERQAARSALCALVLAGGLLVPLASSDGAEGAALALLAATLLRNVVNTVQAWRLAGLDTTPLGLSPGASPRRAARPSP